MKVLKFGGTSVGSVASIRQIQQIIARESEDCVVVVSALGGITDQLLHAAQGIYGRTYEQIAEQFDMSTRQIARIVPRLQNQLFKHIK